MRLVLAAGLVAASIPAIAASPSKTFVATACGTDLRTEADDESFTAAGRGGEVGQLAEATGTNFAAAASQLCASRGLRAADLAPFTRLVVRNTEGATDPVVYDDAEQGPDTLILEYGFADGPAPAAAAIGNAIRCWREPERAGCDQGGE